MAPDFVHYTPDLETFDPDLDETMEQVIDWWEKKVHASPKVEGTGRAQRGAHSKPLGVVKAEVDILEDVPAPYAQGIYATPGRHGALIRYSNASGHLGPDAALGPVLGFAMKIFGVDGPTLIDDEPDSGTFDLVMKNNPVFIANSAKHYQYIQEIGDTTGEYLARGKAGFHDLLSDFLTGKGTLERPDWAWDELFAFVRNAQSPVRNPLVNTYWTMGAFRHGDYVAKVRVAPAADSVAQVTHRDLDLDGGAPDVFGPALIEELRVRSFDYDLQIQLSTDLQTMPVNDVTTEWPEKLSPFVTVARVHIPRQDISGAENLERGDALSFNQWRVTAEHRPLGEIMKVRRIYSESAKVRRTLNHQTQAEPVSADSVLS